MALAEALKSNTTLERLESAALPSNPLTHASRFFVPLNVAPRPPLSSLLDSTFPRCLPRPRTLPWPCPRLCLPTWVTCVKHSKLAPARRRLGDNNLGNDAEQALKAAAGSGLELRLT